MHFLNCISHSCVHSPKLTLSKRLALVASLSIAMAATGCSSQWLNVALTDLPVLTQMALNIATLVTTLQSGKEVDPAAVSAVQNISTEASQDLSLLLSLYKSYEANPSASTLQNIQSTIAKITQGLPLLLQSAHISDPVTSAKVSAGVNLIMTTVASFSALMPQAKPATAQSSPVVKIAIPNAKELKQQWNMQVCGVTSAGASAPRACVVR